MIDLPGGFGVNGEHAVLAEIASLLNFAFGDQKRQGGQVFSDSFGEIGMIDAFFFHIGNTSRGDIVIIANFFDNFTCKYS